jgi:hypothetical protein
MKFRNHFHGVRDPDIIGKEGVHAAPEITGCPALVHNDPGGLATGVDACVGSACTKDRNRAIAEAVEDLFELALNCSRIGLALPT